MNVQLCIRCLAAAVSLGGALVLTGCGLQAAPEPPSLDLPNPVVDLHAVRTGDQVTLTWTMPRRTTDKLLLKDNLAVSICRKDADAACAPAGSLELPPGKPGTFTEALPPALASGSPRLLTYYVELKNHKHRSAGPSNAAVVLAGQAPAPVSGLAATVVKSGVMLHWQAATETTPSAVRLERRLLSAPPPKQNTGELLPPTQAPLVENLLVAADAQPAPPDRALDKTIQFGQLYQYRAQRVERVQSGDKMLELDGPFSAPVSVNAQDVFPPTVPSGLAAVANAPAAGAPASIDLSWQPDSDPGLVGYAVYRREGTGEWQRISPAQPTPGPAFRDANVFPGHTYIYSVTAISQNGHASARSAETSESVPAQ
jgi:hypothetical protein